MSADADHNGKEITLICNGTTWQADAGSGSNLWFQSGSDIYYSSGNVGIGTASPAAPLHVAIPNLTYDLSDGLEDGTLPPLTTSGDANWIVTSSTASEGTKSAQSGAIGDSQSTTLTLSYSPATAATIRFERKVSSEACAGDCDFLVFKIDGVEKGRWYGEVPWGTSSYSVSSGAHTFTWIYSKDDGASSGSDTAWVDNVRIFEGSAGVAELDGNLVMGDGGNIDMSSGGNIVLGSGWLSGDRDGEGISVDDTGNVRAGSLLIGTGGAHDAEIQDDGFGNVVINGPNPTSRVAINIGAADNTGNAMLTVDGASNGVGIGLGSTGPETVLDVGGEIRFSSSGLACSGTTEGAQRYDTATHAIEYCNGTAWTAVGGASALDDFSDAITNYTSASMYIGQGVGATATGQNNLAVGDNAGRALTSGPSNTFIGKSAGRKTTTGHQNTFVGYEAGDQNINGAENVFIGDQAGNANVTGSMNVFVGEDAAKLSIGDHNTAIGNGSAATLVDGTDNILIGYLADVSYSSQSNFLNLGNTIYGDLSTGAVGIGDANFDNSMQRLRVYRQSTNATGGDYQLSRAVLEMAPSADQPTGTWQSGGVATTALSGYATIPNTSTNRVNVLRGAIGSAENSGTGDVLELGGILGWS